MSHRRGDVDACRWCAWSSDIEGAEKMFEFQIPRIKLQIRGIFWRNSLDPMFFFRENIAQSMNQLKIPFPGCIACTFPSSMTFQKTKVLRYRPRVPLHGGNYNAASMNITIRSHMAVIKPFHKPAKWLNMRRRVSQSSRALGSPAFHKSRCFLIAASVISNQSPIGFHDWLKELLRLASLHASLGHWLIFFFATHWSTSCSQIRKP